LGLDRRHRQRCRRGCLGTGDPEGRKPGGFVPPSSLADADPAPVEEKEDFVVLAQSQLVESAEPEGWTSEADGVTHRAWRVRVVNQERVKDVETGYEVLVSQPQEEVILQPVDTF
jgi:hypothetical protein